MNRVLKAAAMQQLSFLSPAKINLFFRVLYKRKDGFHEIASLYQAISLCDVLHVALANEDRFTCTDETLPVDDTNLVKKALALFREKTADSSPFHIHLEKKIPKEAGLGGGSSNAATALFAFSLILQKNISIEVLKEWGALLGCDVPFFFSLGTAYATSRGEILEEVPSSFAFSLWIAKPSWGLSTPKVYGAYDPSFFLEKGSDPKNDLQEFLKGGKPFYNDLEKAAFLLSPQLQKVKENLLKMGFSQVVLSGSGTAFFCLGKIDYLPKLQDVEFFSVNTLQRKERSWYEL